MPMNAVMPRRSTWSIHPTRNREGEGASGGERKRGRGGGETREVNGGQRFSWVCSKDPPT